MRKKLLLFALSLFTFGNGQAQEDGFWSKHTGNKMSTVKNKAVERQSFAETFDLYNLNLDALRSHLFSVKNKKLNAIITIPNTMGQVEQFEMVETSNFDPALQAQFPGIRAYSGKGITDPYATIKLSISPYGIQTMVFRADKESEFIEPYSADGKLYAVYNSQREKGKIAWACSTADEKMVSDINKQLTGTQKSSTGELKTMRLAQSCTGEYSVYHANRIAMGTTPTVAISLAAINETLTRCNGVYEKDLGIHLNLVNNTSIIYLNPNADPYGSTDANYNNELQAAVTAAVGEANYDIGHLFSAIGNNGNAGCIGCVCLTGKGRGFTTSTAPVGDSFDIDFVVHEVGHQLGANHTYSMVNEGSGVNMEPGSGVTIMGYAGITSQDLAPHSIETFHAASIRQIQMNMAGKTCPVTVSANNEAPVVNAGADYVIPISTPFILEGTATDVNGDALTYQWEQYDDDTASQTGTNSDANSAKTIGPNWTSWLPTTNGNRYMPRLSSIIANSATTAATGNDAGILVEALSSVARELNFRLTVRDNAPVSLVVPYKVGQTNFDDKKVTVNASAGPFVLTVPSATGLSYVAGTNQNVTWNVANTNTGAVNTPYVDLYLSQDGGNTYPVLLASKVPNDGSEMITVPNVTGATNRIMARGNGNIFFDISNNNFTIAAPSSSFAVAFNGVAGEQTKGICQGNNSVDYTFNYTALSGFSGVTTFAAAGLPSNATVSFSPTSRTTSGPVTMTVTTSLSTPVGLANIVVNATSGATTRTVPFYLEVADATFGNATLVSPANNANALNTTLTLTWSAATDATLYDVQIATDSGFANIVTAVTTGSTSYMVSGLSEETSYYWRVLPRNATCNGAYTPSFRFITGDVVCNNVSNNTVRTIGSVGKPLITSTINIPSGVTINDLNLSVDITHANVGDLILTLTGPTGASAIVLDQSCDGNVNMNATFDDSGNALVCGSNPAINGYVIPLNALSVFNGTSATGTWTFTVKDNRSGDGGSLNSWGLNICSIQPSLSNPDFEMTNVKVYPNPNKGKFNIEFLSESDDTVEVKVYDLRGRQIFDASYAVSGMFNQEISLDNVQSGMYLVSINNGAKKSVKRIIVE